jgi:RNA polymerase sigma-70 factor, ECF subfamily
MQPPVARVFATEWPRLVATLVRDLGDLGLAEDVAQDAFVEATHRWVDDASLPERPGAWLLTTARRKAIDRVRRDRRFASRLPLLVERSMAEPAPRPGAVDDQLALIFGCCHPSLAIDAQIALTLRHVGGLTTAQIARAFLVPEATMAKRLTRAKHKIRAAGVPFIVPGPRLLEQRLDAVLGVIYLIFTEGHTASTPSAATTATGPEVAATDPGLVRGDLCDEARWLAGLVADLVPDRPEALGLAALLAFTDARRATRTGADGALVLLEDQDRSRWDADLIATGHHRLETALLQGAVGPYQLQAAIAAVHASAGTSAATNWPMIVDLYTRLHAITPNAVIELNRAVAISMAEGAAVGLRHLDELAATGELDGYRYLHAARADLLRKLDRRGEAVVAYRRALELTDNPAERAFLVRRIADVT